MIRSLLLASLVVLGCRAADPRLELADPGPIDSVEVRFGSHCRLLERPTEVEPLAAFLQQHLEGWEPFWGEPGRPDVEARFRADGRTVALLGLDRSQLVSRIGERAVFKPISDATATRLVELMGGPPTTAAESPCSSLDE